MLNLTDDDIFDKKAEIANENDLLEVADRVLNGNIPAYCNLKMYFICKFPLVSKVIKDKHTLTIFTLMKEQADIYQNPFAQAMLGWMFWSGTGASINKNHAIDYISKSSDKNNPVGLVEKGFIEWITAKKEYEKRSVNKLFVKALELSSSNGYAQHALGLYHAIQLKDNMTAIKHFTNAVTEKCLISTPNLAYLLYKKTMTKEAFDLYKLTSYYPVSAFHLAVFLSIPQVINSKLDYVKALKYYLIAMVSGYPVAQLTIDLFKNCKVKAFGEAVAHIEQNFISIVNLHEQSETNVLLTPADIFSKLKNEFDAISNIKITSDTLGRNPETQLYDHINMSYALCILSSNNNKNLSINIDELTLLDNVQKETREIIKKFVPIKR